MFPSTVSSCFASIFIRWTGTADTTCCHLVTSCFTWSVTWACSPELGGRQRIRLCEARFRSCIQRSLILLKKDRCVSTEVDRCAPGAVSLNSLVAVPSHSSITRVTSVMLCQHLVVSARAWSHF
uniref:Secreted protein n=1 Tax=Cacopsylla melanoneura TaxID=428564 RepID=A0A8D8TXL5_9HEMI